MALVASIERWQKEPNATRRLHKSLGRFTETNHADPHLKGSSKNMYKVWAKTQRFLSARARNTRLGTPVWPLWPLLQLKSCEARGKPPGWISCA